MLDQVTIQASDVAASERFYRTVLGAIGVEPTRARRGEIEWDDLALTAVGAGGAPTRNLHVGFATRSRAAVDAFWRAGIDAGYEDDGAPGERPEYTPSYYGAFLRDPDGNSAEAVHHSDVRRGGCVDHLWIRVRGLEAASGFYATLAPQLGLRPGRSWEDGRQFRGAWATLSLVADGLPATERLRLAFPAPDRETVDDFHRAGAEAGYRDGGPPQAAPGRYAACLLDPAGAEVESVFSERR